MPIWLTDKGTHTILHDKQSVDAMDRVLLGLVDGNRGRAELVKRLGHPALVRIDHLIAVGLLGESGPVGAESQANSPSVSHVAQDVFTRTYGDAGVGMLQDLIERAGPDASPARVAQLCADALTPLIGADMADSYFKPFY